MYLILGFLLGFITSQFAKKLDPSFGTTYWSIMIIACVIYGSGTYKYLNHRQKTKGY